MSIIFPNVSKIKTNLGSLNLPETLSYYFVNKMVNAFIMFNRPVKEVKTKEDAIIIFEENLSLKPDEYDLKVDDKIYISYGTDSGAFYAIQSLKQLINVNTVQHVEIHDQPVTKVRGFMLDISRNKVAKTETIKSIIDLMADLKMNHLELYVEGFSFEYKTFKDYLIDDGYVTLEEYLELEKYANDRFIDFVPNQNGFGHMTEWLEKEELKSLAVCPDGINLWGRWRKPSTLNPLNEGSVELVKKMYADMIPHMKSKYFNMNFDEPFELGKGYTEGYKPEDVYVDFLNKVYPEVKKYNKIPLMWGDVLVRHPHKWDELPKDMIFVDWGYDAPYSFANHAKLLKEKGVKFMCAPGSTSWSSFLGRYLDWYENIKNAIDAVYDYQGEGVLLTDWGDFGHLQFWSVTLAPLIYTGLYSWSHKEGTILKVRDYLNRYLNDKKDIIGDMILDLNHYSRYDVDYAGNGSRSFYTFMWASVAIYEAKSLGITPLEYFKNKCYNTRISYEKFKLMDGLFDYSLKNFGLLELDSNAKLRLVVDELKQTILTLKMIIRLSLSLNEDIDLEDRIKHLDFILENKDEELENQEKLWLVRNKSGGLETSINHLKEFFDFVVEMKNYLENKKIN